MQFSDYLKDAVGMGASDIHISVGLPISYRINGELRRADDVIIMPDLAAKFIFSIMDEGQKAAMEKAGELDFAYSLPGTARFRVNAFKQRSSLAAALRVINSDPPTPEQLSLPEIVSSFTELKRGLVLVVGPTGSGKSTTLAALISEINKTRAVNIITLEDPIEYLHKSQKSIVSQREVGVDTHSYSSALRAALRQDPDVILVGEMRDLDTISIALRAAETGHLVFSTLHTLGAAKTIDRITDSFPPHQQNQVRLQLSTALKAVVSQQLLLKKEGFGRVAAFEVMVTTPAVANLIRENKTNQVANVLLTGRDKGMIPMDGYLEKLYRDGIISKETAEGASVDKLSL